jgi:hypothetical protein
MLLTGFQTSVLATDRPQTHTLDRTATGIGSFLYWRAEIPHFYYLNVISRYGSTDKAPTYLAVQKGRIFRRSVGVGGERTEHLKPIHT